MQTREQRHFRWLAQIRETIFHFTRRFLHFFRIGVRQLLQNRQMPDRFVELKVFSRLHCLRADLAKALQVIRILPIDNDRRVPGRFVDDVGRGRVFDVMDLAHVARDDQDLVSLKFHERRRRNETVHRHRAPLDLAQDVVHLLDARNALERNPGIEQALEINFMSVLLQKKSVLPHDETPDRMID